MRKRQFSQHGNLYTFRNHETSASKTVCYSNYRNGRTLNATAADTEYTRNYGILSRINANSFSVSSDLLTFASYIYS